MNSQMIRKIAIAKLLGEMFEHSCKYSPETLARDDNPIEPDDNALFEFRLKLSELANLHYQNRLTSDKVKEVQDFVSITGSKYGHITYSYNTGTWGVRHSELSSMIDILNIPDFELLPVNSPYKIYDLNCTIESYEITHHYLWAKLKPDNHEVYGFSIDFNWKQLANETCNIRMYSKLEA